MRISGNQKEVLVMPYLPENPSHFDRIPAKKTLNTGNETDFPVVAERAIEATKAVQKLVFMLVHK